MAAAPGAGGAAAAAAANTTNKQKIARLAVFCGSRSGARPSYAAAAAELGAEMARRGIRLTYGGGTVGLMGTVARSVQEGFAAVDGAASTASTANAANAANAATAAAQKTPPPPPAVLGFIPALLAPREIGGDFIGETRIVADMHERKAAMAQHSDAFVALPGGFGTLEEVLEAMTWQQLGYHAKPVGFLDTDGFYAHLGDQFALMVREGFVMPQVAAQVIVRGTPTALLDAICAWTPPERNGLQLHADEMRERGGAGEGAGAAMARESATAVGVDISRPSGAAE
jgi:cytokinin riboside 5'-monophosphate phosphoribohydrolase